MNNSEALAKLKYLTAKNQFLLVNRRLSRAQAVTSSLAKEIVKQLTIADFQKYEADRDRLNEFVWIYETDYGAVYYIKFKFINDSTMVRFISFHVSNYS